MKGLWLLFAGLIIESVVALPDTRNRFSQFSQFRSARQKDGTNGNGNGNNNRNGNNNGNGYGPPTDSYGPPTEQTEAPSGPYPPSGWKPNGDLLLVPGETHSSLNNGNGNGWNGNGNGNNGNGWNGNGNGNYGPPPPPDQQYGQPNKPTTQATTTSTTTTTEIPQPDPDATNIDTNNPNPGNGSENGQYYVLLPDGKLQRVKYSGKKKGRKQYEALVEYELVDPIRSPVYTYQGVPLNFS